MRERNIKIISILLILLSVAVLHVKLYRFAEITHDGALQVLVCLGRVVAIDTSDEADQVLTFRILSGQFRGEMVEVNNIWTGRAFGDRVLSRGDVLFLDIPLRDPSNPTLDNVRMREYFRTPFLLYLAGALGMLMILVAGMKGVRAILTLFVTALAVLYLLVPLTIAGYNPIAIALGIAAVLTLTTFVLITGFSFKVVSGVLGTLGGLAAVGVLSVISQHALVLTGLAQEFGFLELGIALWRTPESHHWNFTGILSAGIILGAVGAMMDVSMSISSSVHEVKQVNPNITVRQSIRAGLNVGRDIMGTMADTLIFAYLGAHMMTMLLPRIDFPEAGILYPFPQTRQRRGDRGGYHPSRRRHDWIGTDRANCGDSRRVPHPIRQSGESGYSRRPAFRRGIRGTVPCRESAQRSPHRRADCNGDSASRHNLCLPSRPTEFRHD